MKVDNSHSFNVNNLENITGAEGLDSPRRAKIPNTFTIPEPDQTSRTHVAPEPVQITADIQKILSAEEKRLFEMLFSPAANENIGRPSKAYAVQQNHIHDSGTSGVPETKILGKYLDIRG